MRNVTRHRNVPQTKITRLARVLSTMSRSNSVTGGDAFLVRESTTLEDVVALLFPPATS